MLNQPQFIESFGITTKLFTFDMDVKELSQIQTAPKASDKKEDTFQMEISFGNSVFENRDIKLPESSQDNKRTVGLDTTHNVKEMFYYDSYGNIMPKTIQVKLKQDIGIHYDYEYGLKKGKATEQVEFLSDQIDIC